MPGPGAGGGEGLREAVPGGWIPGAGRPGRAGVEIVTGGRAPGPGAHPWRRWARLIVALTAGVALVAGCGEEPPPLRPLPKDAVVLAFGDSLTRGTGARDEESYPAVLARLIGRRVINAGIPGEESGEGLRRLPALLARYEPDLVIVCHGGNDILRRRDPEVTKANLRRMLALVRESGAQAVLVGVPAPGLFLSAAPFYEALAAETGVPFEGEALAEILDDNRLKSDAVHPNGTGYRRLAEALAKRLVEAGAVPPAP